MSFKHKILKAVITLKNGLFANGTNTITLVDYPMSAKIKKMNMPYNDTCTLKIFNLKKDTLSALTFLIFKPLSYQPNTVELYGGEDEKNLELIYSGDVITAYPDFNQAPDVVMTLELVTAGYQRVVAVPPYSTPGRTAVADIVKTIATQMGLSFKNEGVTKFVDNPYIEGNNLRKLAKIAEDYNIDIIVDNNTCVIRPKSGQTLLTWKLTAYTGMIGYPSFNQNGIVVRAFLMSNVRLGDLVDVVSNVPRASGIWQVQAIEHNVSCKLADGTWETELICSYRGVER